MENSLMQKKTASILIKLVGLIALIMWFYSSYLYDVFRTFPDSPNSVTGNVVPFLWKTHNVYITSGDSFEYNFLFYGSIGLFVIYAMSYLWAQKKYSDPVVFPEAEMRTFSKSTHKKMLVFFFFVIIALLLFSYFKTRF
jgi:hypothetical protein